MRPRFDGPEIPIPGAVLTILRTVADWRQKQLAVAAGMSESDQISDYETGRTALPLSRVHELAAVMGLPPHQVDATIAYLDEGRAAAARHRAGGAEAAVAAKMEGFAAGVGRSFRDLTRESFAHLLDEARIVETRRQAPALWARLRPHKTGARRALVREVAEFQSWALCELLCAESERTAAHDGEVAIDLGELAVEIAIVAPEEEPWRRRLEGFARAFAANAVRAASRPGAAGEAFDRALQVWESGAPADPYPLDGSRLLDLEASLRRDQRRLDESLALLDRALLVHPAGPAAGRLLIKRAQTQEALGDYEGAVATLRRAAQQIDPESDPRLVFIQRVNLALDLGYLGRAAAGEELLPEARRLAAQLGNRLDLLRVRWVEGLLADRTGRRAGAVAALEEVRDGFVGLRMPYDAALATMQLAVVLFGDGGRAAEVKNLAAQARPIFEDEGVHAEARKALALFRRAAEQERATLEFARRLTAYLECARGVPDLAFVDAA
jgi:tetratricopeptide (TPR) repeat protein